MRCLNQIPEYFYNNRISPSVQRCFKKKRFFFPCPISYRDLTKLLQCFDNFPGGGANL